MQAPGTIDGQTLKACVLRSTILHVNVDRKLIIQLVVEAHSKFSRHVLSAWRRTVTCRVGSSRRLGYVIQIMSTGF